MENLEPWLSVLEKLIWPIFIIVLLFAFRKKVNGLYKMATEGRSLEIGGWLKIGEQVKETDIQKFATDDASIDAVEGDGFMVEKGGNRYLNELQTRLREGKIRQIDVLNIVDNKHYYKKMLLEYVSTLGIKYIVFTNNGKFEGWIDGSIFSSQILMGDYSSYGYDELKNSLYGIKTEKIASNTKTFEVLSYMKKQGLDVIPIIDNDKFKYFVNKSDILTSIISSNILNKSDEE